MTKSQMIKGFSLIELLVALSVLAVVAALVVPRYLNVQSQTQSTVAQQMATELNNTYANWKTSGGVVQAGAMTSDILTVLTGVGSQPLNDGSGGQKSPGLGLVKDSGTSQNIRASAPTDLVAALKAINSNPPLPQSLVQTHDFTIAFDGSQFTVIPQSVLQSLRWGAPQPQGLLTLPWSIPSNASWSFSDGGPTYTGVGPATSVSVLSQVNGQLVNFGTIPTAPLTSGTTYGYYSGNYYQITYRCGPPGFPAGIMNVNITLSLGSSATPLPSP